jgi:hypothetical protein
MARIDINLPDELEDRLRMEAGRRLGAKRGAFTQAITEGIAMWIANEIPEAELRKIVESVSKKKGEKSK